MGVCGTHRWTLHASIHLTLSLDQVFKHVTPALVSATSIVSPRLFSVFSILLEWSWLKLLIPNVTRSVRYQTNAENYAFFSAPFAALSSFSPTQTAICFSLASITVFLINFSVSIRLLRRQGRRFFLHPHQFFRHTFGHFIQIV